MSWFMHSENDAFLHPFFFSVLSLFICTTISAVRSTMRLFMNASHVCVFWTMRVWDDRIIWWLLRGVSNAATNLFSGTYFCYFSVDLNIFDKVVMQKPMDQPSDGQILL